MMGQLRTQEEQTYNNGGSGSEAGFRSNLHFNPKVEFPTFDDIKDGLKNVPDTFLFVGFMMSRRWIWQLSISRGQLRSGLVAM